jgi:hypothetical protein
MGSILTSLFGGALYLCADLAVHHSLSEMTPYTLNGPVYRIANPVARRGSPSSGGFSSAVKISFGMFLYSLCLF